MKDLRELAKRTGSMQQLAYVRPLIFGEGRSSGLKASAVKCGNLSFLVLSDKCMDIGELSYRGINMSFIAKGGLQGIGHCGIDSSEAQRSIMGGFMFTSGTSNICAPCVDEGVSYPMHGRMRTTPAEHLGSDVLVDGDRYVVTLSGEMREAELFGENMVLRRRIESVLGEDTIVITDEIENESFRDEPLLLLYHINLGYPLIDEGIRLHVPGGTPVPRDEVSAAAAAGWNTMPAPRDNEPEYVYIHKPEGGEDGCVHIRVENEAIGVGMELSYTAANLPLFMEWQSTASGDYVLGLEPANTSVYGRLYQKEHGGLHRLGPGEKEANTLKFRFFDL